MVGTSLPVGAGRPQSFGQGVISFVSLPGAAAGPPPLPDTTAGEIGSDECESVTRDDFLLGCILLPVIGPTRSGGAA